MEHLFVKGKAGERVLGRAYGFGFHGESEEGRKGRGLATAARACLSSPNASPNAAVGLEGEGVTQQERWGARADPGH